MDNATETLTLIVTECEAGVWYAATLYQSKATKLTLRTGALGLGYVYGVQSRSGLLVTIASRCSGYDVNPDMIEFRPLAA